MSVTPFRAIPDTKTKTGAHTPLKKLVILADVIAKKALAMNDRELQELEQRYEATRTTRTKKSEQATSDREHIQTRLAVLQHRTANKLKNEIDHLISEVTSTIRDLRLSALPFDGQLQRAARAAWFSITDQENIRQHYPTSDVKLTKNGKIIFSPLPQLINLLPVLYIDEQNTSDTSLTIGLENSTKFVDLTIKNSSPETTSIFIDWLKRYSIDPDHLTRALTICQ